MLATGTATKLIYIIEDDLASATLIREALELEGDPSWALRIIIDGSAALQAIQHETPDLVLLDLFMPGADGGAIFRQLRDQPATMNLPILFISGATTHDLHNNGVDDGVLLRKPVNLAILLHVVHTHLHS